MRKYKNDGKYINIHRINDKEFVNVYFDDQLVLSLNNIDFPFQNIPTGNINEIKITNGTIEFFDGKHETTSGKIQKMDILNQEIFYYYFETSENANRIAVIFLKSEKELINFRKKYHSEKSKINYLFIFDNYHGNGSYFLMDDNMKPLAESLGVFIKLFTKFAEIPEEKVMLSFNDKMSFIALEMANIFPKSDIHVINPVFNLDFFNSYSKVINYHVGERNKDITERLIQNSYSNIIMYHQRRPINFIDQYKFSIKAHKFGDYKSVFFHPLILRYTKQNMFNMELENFELMGKKLNMNFELSSENEILIDPNDIIYAEVDFVNSKKKIITYKLNMENNRFTLNENNFFNDVLSDFGKTMMLLRVYTDNMQYICKEENYLVNFETKEIISQ